MRRLSRRRFWNRLTLKAWSPWIRYELKQSSILHHSWQQTTSNIILNLEELVMGIGEQDVVAHLKLSSCFIALILTTYHPFVGKSLPPQCETICLLTPVKPPFSFVAQSMRFERPLAREPHLQDFIFSREICQSSENGSTNQHLIETA